MNSLEESLIEYALGAPDWNITKMLLIDILCGCTGADNVNEVRKSNKWFRMAAKYGVVE